MAELKKGDNAPGFELIDQKETVIRLSDYRGGKLLLFFYPKAGSSG